MTLRIYLTGTLFCAFLATGCNVQEKAMDFDYGRVENNKYLNSFFDVELTLPADWIIQTKEQMEALTNKGKELMSGDDAKMKALLKASEINTANLLAAYQFEPGSAVDFNPSILVVAENVKNLPGIKNGSDYLFQARRLLEQSQVKYDHLDKTFEKESINGTDFHKMNAEINYMGVSIKQIYYSTILKSFSFNVIISFSNDEQKLDLLKSLNSMKFLN